MELIAHSIPRKKPDLKPHSYAAHIQEVHGYGVKIANIMLAYGRYSKTEQDVWLKSLIIAIQVHDMGKLDSENQAVLSGNKKERGLPVDHIDAGVATCGKISNLLSAWLIRAHHAPGLADRISERNLLRHLGNKYGVTHYLRGARHNRNETDKYQLEKHYNDVISKTDERIEGYIKIQESICGQIKKIPYELPADPMSVRLLLSCLVDADHSSAASYSTQTPMPEVQSIEEISDKCHWEKRLSKLKAHVSELPNKATDAMEKQRNILRGELFNLCLNADSNLPPIVSCAAPVGLGKTTSVMSYLIRKAMEKNLRHIFVVAPFTNIISQTAKTLKEALVLEGEDPDNIIVEHHHKVDFSDPDFRQYATLWRAPIVVTTAVQFFQTLASAHPTELRKLHELSGSAIFIDESHACLPPHLLRVTWHWLNLLAQKWSCEIVMASGSMFRFWNHDDVVDINSMMKVPDLMDESFYKKAFSDEKKRVKFQTISGRMSLKTLIAHVVKKTGNTKNAVVILNTVQSAAVVAKALAKKIDENKKITLKERKVLHLSTALTPIDRECIIEELQRRQQECEWSDKTWYLVATSCVEAGIDLDFSLGYRERCSVTSYYQTAGRINRHNKKPGAILYDCTLDYDGSLVEHRGFRRSRSVFEELWNRIEAGDDISELSTLAVRREAVLRNKTCVISKDLAKNEFKYNYQNVNENYKIIESDTLTVVINEYITQQLLNAKPVTWQTIQMNSIQIWGNKLSEYGVSEIGDSGIYQWDLEYNNFLGYMAGALTVIQANKTNAYYCE